MPGSLNQIILDRIFFLVVLQLYALPRILPLFSSLVSTNVTSSRISLRDLKIVDQISSLVQFFWSGIVIFTAGDTAAVQQKQVPASAGLWSEQERH